MALTDWLTDIDYEPLPMSDPLNLLERKPLINPLQSFTRVIFNFYNNTLTIFK